jgi:hypothetical protein
VQVGLADEDGAGGAQAGHDGGVFFGHAIVKNGAGRIGTDAGGIDVVLESDGDAVQRAAEFSGFLFGVQLARVGRGLFA